VSAPAVLVLGDVMTDVVARVAGPPVPATDTPARIAIRPGGSAANTAAWLAALGVPATLVGRVGDDDAGRAAVAALRAAGVTPHVTVAPGAATGACVVLVDPAGERTMLPDAGANALLEPADLPAQAFAAGGHLHVSGYALARESTRPAAVAALERARRAGMTTSVDPASAAPLAPAGGAAVRAAAREADVVIATPDEAEALHGARDPGAAAEALLADHAEVVLKLGAAGALWRDRAGREARAPAAVPPGPVVDSTGAGDAFAAAWLAARRKGRAPADALAEACRTAALAVTRPGARPESASAPR
jgi:ribokinase